MKIVFIGSVKFSKVILEKLISLKEDISGVCTLRESNLNSDFCDLSSLANLNKIPCKYIENINSKETIDWIKKKEPDYIFCFGFSKLLKKEILNVPKKGVIGYHPTLLPSNRGRHPLIWALALGLKETGSTFFFMDEGADSGDILSQTKFSIDEKDNAASLYKKAINQALKQLEEFLPKLKSNNYSRVKQDDSLANTWRKRNISDGVIDWRMSAKTIHNLIRALSDPYVGAHFNHGDKKIVVKKAKKIPNKDNFIESGKVIDRDINGCFTIKCGEDSIKLIDTYPLLMTSIGDYL